MGKWFFGEREGAASKHGSTEEAMAPTSAAPLPLLAIFFIMFLLLSIPSYVNYKKQMKITAINFKMFLFFLPVLMALLALLVYKWERFFLPGTKARYHGSGERSSPPSSWNVPWGMVLLVVLLLVMAFYHSTF